MDLRHRIVATFRQRFGTDPEFVARAPGRVNLLGEHFSVDHPEGRVCHCETGQAAKPIIQLLLLHYLTHSDGTPLAGEWVAFRDLPDARWYEPAFASGVNARILSAFGNNVEEFVRSSLRLGGDPLSFGDASFVFRMLPRLWMSIVIHRGDEEFGPEVTVLFDAAAGRHLPAEDLVYIGGHLASRLLRAKGVASSD